VNETRRHPVLTLILVALNIVAAYVVVFWPLAVTDFGFNAAKPTPWTPLTSLFLHNNLWHLLGNMVFLAAVGPAVESAAKVWRFGAVYFVGGLVGVLFHFIFARSAPGILVGASGCVAACIAYYNLRHVHLQVHLAPKVGISVLGMTFLWILLQVLGTFFPNGSPTAYWAHLGGFAAGLLLSLLFRAPKQADQQLGHTVIDRMEGHSAAAKLAAAEIHLTEHPDDVQALFRKAEALAHMDDHSEEGAVLHQLYQKLPENDRPPVANRMLQIGQIGRLTSLERTKLAEKVEPSLGRRLLLSIVSDSKDNRRAEALLALIPLCDADEAALWKKELTAVYPLHPATELARARGLL
jgi:membrane associated rhomboid family serine protease